MVYYRYLLQNYGLYFDYRYNTCISGSNRRSIKTWNIKDGKCLNTLTDGHSNVVFQVLILSNDLITTIGQLIKQLRYVLSWPFILFFICIFHGFK